MKALLVPRLGILAASLLALVACTGTADDIQARIQRADRFQLDGQYKAAVIELKNVLQAQPQNGVARSMLAQVYLEVGDGASAEKELRRLLEQGLVEEREVLVDLAKAQLLNGNFSAFTEESVDATMRRIETAGLTPTRTALLLALHGHGFFFENQPAAATQFYEKALAIDENDKEALLGQAMVSAYHGDVAQASSALRALLQLDPKFAKAWSLLGDLERAEGSLEAAKAAYSEAIEHRERNASDLFKRGLTLIALGDIDGAKQDASRLQEAAGKVFETNYLTGVVEINNQNYEAASISLQAALNQRPSDLPARYYAGLSAAKQGLWNQATLLLEGFLASSPQYSEQAQKLLAWVELNQGDVEAARVLLEQVLVFNPNDADTLELLGMLALEAGEGERSTELFQKLVEVNPESDRGFVKLGMGFLQQGKVSEARVAWSEENLANLAKVQRERLLIEADLASGSLEQALARIEFLKALQPDSPEPWLLEGRAKLVGGDTAAAVGAFEEGHRRDPDHFPTVKALVEISLSQSQPAVARGYIEAFVSRQSKDLDGLLALSDVMLFQNEPDAAAAVLERAREAHADAWRPRVMLARHYRVAGRPALALTLAVEAQAIEPLNPAVLRELGHTQFDLGQAAAAADTYQSWVRQQPRSAGAYFYAARAEAATGQLDQAKDSLEQVLVLDPDRDTARIALARIYLTGRETQKAEKVMGPLVKRLPDQPDVLALRGDLAVQHSDFPAAVAFFKAALEKAPSSSLVRSMGYAQINNGQASQTAALWEAWLVEKPEDWQIRSELAGLYLLGKEPARAREHYAYLVETGQANGAVFSRLADIAAADGDLESALSYAEKAAASDQTNHGYLASLGALALKAGLTERALREIEKAIDLAPYEPGYQYQKAQALSRMGRAEEARGVLEKLLRDSPASFEGKADAAALLKELM